MRISGSGQRRQNVDDFSNNKRSNGSKKHPLKSAILMPRASRSVVRHLRGKSPDTSPRYKSPETSSGDLQVPAESPPTSPRASRNNFQLSRRNVHSAFTEYYNRRRQSNCSTSPQ